MYGSKTKKNTKRQSNRNFIHFTLPFPPESSKITVLNPESAFHKSAQQFAD
ncbi:hypothetical protein BIWAKO_05705 [Bosea sp. BIWAKO-01]|nr:hypothetical protein BIWAKO_05705 [Bosea sp. BIWAKO-01]